MYPQLQSLYPLIRPEEINVDFFCCKLVRKFLLATLIVFCLHSAYMFYHRPALSCLTTAKVDADVVNAKCSLSGTYVLAKPESWEADSSYVTAAPNVRSDLPKTQDLYPGIRPRTNPPAEKVNLLLQQFVWVFYGICAVLSYLPSWCWTYWSDGILKEIVTHLKPKSVRDEDIKQEFERAVSCFYKSVGTHNWLAFMFLFTLILYMISVMGQFYAIVYIAKGNWMFGLEIYSLANESFEIWPYDLATIFPRASACDVRWFGPSGSVTKIDALCFTEASLSNILMLTSLWFVYIFCIAVIGISVVWQLVDIAVPCVSRFCVRKALGISKNSKAGKVLEEFTFGSNLLVLLLSKNLPNYKVCDLLTRLEGEFKMKRVEIARRRNGYME